MIFINGINGLNGLWGNDRYNTKNLLFYIRSVIYICGYQPFMKGIINGINGQVSFLPMPVRHFKSICKKSLSPNTSFIPFIPFMRRLE